MLWRPTLLHILSNPVVVYVAPAPPCPTQSTSPPLRPLPFTHPPLPDQAELQLARRLCEGASIVVADEAHTIKNPASKTNRAMGKIRTRARLALTGYPLQNNLEEYYCMIHWVGG